MLLRDKFPRKSSRVTIKCEKINNERNTSSNAEDVADEEDKAVGK